MKESLWGYWIILLGIFVVVIMMLVSNVTSSSTQDYYMIKDVTEAAMVDAIDYSYYRQFSELRINREKFVENFLRRFAENASINTYQIDFYDIYEAPPKASVKVTTKSGTYRVMGDSTSFDIVEKIDAVLELNGASNGSSVMENATRPNNVTPSTGTPPSLDNSGSDDNLSYIYNPNISRIPTERQLLAYLSENLNRYFWCPGLSSNNSSGDREDNSTTGSNSGTISGDLYYSNSVSILNRCFPLHRPNKESKFIEDFEQDYGITFTEREKLVIISRIRPYLKGNIPDIRDIINNR
ncbi:MAG: hypothetical protein HFH86_04595 [Bacilli bacterium]|jgi:hypothetical protein|nr:hypothetical protein [Bacilli bacterium]